MGGAALEDPKGVARAAKASMAEHVRAMLAYAHSGVPTVDYGNNIRQMALEEGVKDAFDFPGFVPAYIRPLFCDGVGPFAGRRCRAIRRISIAPTPRSRS